MLINCCHPALVCQFCVVTAFHQHHCKMYSAQLVAKIMYCAPAWTGICSAADRLRLDRFLSRCKRNGFCATDLPSVTELHSDADDALFETIMTNSAHILPVAVLGWGQGGTGPPNLAQAPQIFDWSQGCIGVYRRTRVYAVYQPLVFFDSV